MMLRRGVAVCGLILLSGLGVVRAQSSGLGLEQLNQLLQAHTPDDIVAKAIAGRGLSFALTADEVTQLKSAGAGPSAVAALTRLLPMGTLDLSAPRGAEIKLDGNDAGAVDQNGRLRLERIPAGHHHLEASAPGFTSGAYDIVIAGDQDLQFRVALSWGGGYLTVQSNLRQAQVSVSGLGRLPDPPSDIPVPAGSYTVSGSAPNMQPLTLTVTVAPGQHALADLRFAADANFLASRRAELRGMLDRGDARSAAEGAAQLLALKPQDAGADQILLDAYVQERDVRDLDAAASKILQRGGTVTLTVLHDHPGLSGDSAHPALLSLNAQSITYDPGGAECNHPRFTADLKGVLKAEANDRGTSGMFVVRHLYPGTSELQLQVRNPEKPSDKITLYLLVPPTKEVSVNNIGFLQSGPNSSPVIDLIANWIRAEMRAGQ